MAFYFNIAGFLFLIAQVIATSSFVREGHLKLSGYVSACRLSLFAFKTSILCVIGLFSVACLSTLVRRVFINKVSDLMFVLF